MTNTRKQIRGIVTPSVVPNGSVCFSESPEKTNQILDIRSIFVCIYTRFMDKHAKQVILKI